MRDALLSVSGLLTAKDSGPPIWPELPVEVLQANPAFLDDNAEKTKGWYPSPKAEQFARGIFLVQKRTVKVPFMETFDLPDNAVSCARRDQSIVAPQALTLLNGPLTIEAAKALAQRIQREAGDAPDAQVPRAFRLTLQRRPAPDEALACRKLLQQRSLPELCRALLHKLARESGLHEPMLDATSIIQWALYYPAVVDADELKLSEAETSALADSLKA